MKEGTKVERFGAQLSAARKVKGYTQEQMAEKLAVSRTNISRWESGKMTPDLDTVKRLSQILECNFLSHEDAPAKETADAVEAPVFEAEAPPAPKSGKRRIRLLIAACVAIVCVAMSLHFLYRPKANVSVSPLSPIAYLETDEEIGDCWRVTFAFQNESDVPFTPDHVVALFCEGDRIDDKIQLPYDEIRLWMDNDSLRKQDSPLHLLFISNHLYLTRIDCVMYGTDANGHELQFKGRAELSLEPRS